ncbi:MAG: hypothetical protein R3C69_01125 [Geminicoccaceae bacterium]
MRDGRSSGGSGIGLALVRRIVQRLGGTMRVESDGATPRDDLRLRLAPSTARC